MAAEPVNVNEFQILAKQVLPKMYYDFYAGGAEDQYTLKQNVEAFQRIMFRPRILIDVSRITMSTTILGYTISEPIMIAPNSMHKLAHPDGEVATARAAAACNTIMVVSYSSNCSLEEVAASCNAVRFFQFYVYKRRDIAAKMVQRAEKNGYKAIVLTADSPRIGQREADTKNKLVLPSRGNLKGLLSSEAALEKGQNEVFINQVFDASLCWKDVEWLKSFTSLPILIKGVLNREDGKMEAASNDYLHLFISFFSFSLLCKDLLLVTAIKAMEVGVSGIIVSNHGGRQLNYASPTISVLEEVANAVKGKIPVLFDGGVRRGTDVFKALALGAQAVFVGRPIVFGLAVKGENGVRQVIEMLKNELELTMALSGCPSLKDITRNHVSTQHDRLQSML